MLALYEHWRSICPPGRLPGRKDFDPIKMPRAALPWVVIIDVIETGARREYRYRLVGTSSVNVFGGDPTGALASEWHDYDYYDKIAAAYDATVEEAVPTFWSTMMPHQRLETIQFLRGLFPMAEDGRSVNLLLGIGAPFGVDLSAY